MGLATAAVRLLFFSGGLRAVALLKRRICLALSRQNRSGLWSSRTLARYQLRPKSQHVPAHYLKAPPERGRADSFVNESRFTDYKRDARNEGRYIDTGHYLVIYRAGRNFAGATLAGIYPD